MDLKQHGFELHKFTYMWIFFNKYGIPIFSFYTSLSVVNNLCLLKITICGMKRTRIWTWFYLSKLFQFLTFRFVIHQFLSFLRQRQQSADFNCMQVGTLNPIMFKGQLWWSVYNNKNKISWVLLIGKKKVNNYSGWGKAVGDTGAYFWRMIERLSYKNIPSTGRRHAETQKYEEHSVITK